TAAKNRGIQRRKFVVADRDYLTEPAPENLRMFFQTFGRTNKDHALFADGFLDVGVNRLAIELRLYSGQKFTLLLRNPETLERPLYVFGDLIPRTCRALTLREIIADLAEIDGFEILARPVGRQRLALESLQRFQTKFADPVWVLFHVGNVIHDMVTQADAGIEAVIDFVMKVAFIAID